MEFSVTCCFYLVNIVAAQALTIQIIQKNAIFLNEKGGE